MELRASYIERKEVEFELHSSLISPPDRQGISTIRVGLPAAKHLLYALRDALRAAGEDV